jgi:hypothetical protein
MKLSRKISWLLLLASLLVVFFICACGNDDDDEYEGPTDGSGYGAGTPYKQSAQTAVDTLHVNFLVVGDPQFWGGGDRNSHRLARGRMIANDVDISENDEHVLGTVVVGDLTNSDAYHELVAFRQMYESSYPGYDHGCIYGLCDGFSDTWYSGDAHVDKHVYPLLGNHDDVDIAEKYVRDRLKDSESLYYGNDAYGNEIDNWYDEGLYAWEWGSVHCLSLGPWAFFAGDYSHPSEMSEEKAEWLKNHLKQVGKQKPIMMFQHFPFPDEDRWWTEPDREAFVNVICDRESDDEKCQPYNIIALFSGHTHAWGHNSNILDGYANVGNYSIPNWVVDDAGFQGGCDDPPDDCDCDEHTECCGYYRVHVWVDSNKAANYRVDKRIFVGVGSDRDWGQQPTMIESPRSEHSNGWDYVWHNGDDYSYTPSLVTWEQGEQSDSNGGEDCTAMHDNGRFNDGNCDAERHVLCWTGSDDGFRISNAAAPWNEAWQHCYWEERGEIFAKPEIYWEQRAVIDKMKSEGYGSIWVNYTDQRKEGHFESVPYLAEHYAKGQPNDGNLMPHLSQGEDCTYLMKESDGTLVLLDADCSTYYLNFLCVDRQDEKFVVSESKGYFWQGPDVCNAEGGWDWVFSIPTSSTSPQLPWDQLAGDISNFTDQHSTVKIWFNLNDTNYEGRYEERRPGIGYHFSYMFDSYLWATGHPTTDDTKNYVAFTSHGWMDQDGSESLRHACRNSVTGDWKASAESGSWLDGFRQCRSLGANWYFGHPQNYESDQIEKYIAGFDSLWLNWTDEHEEGVWRPGVATNWAANNPVAESDDCALIDLSDTDYHWTSASCNESHPALCQIKDPDNPETVQFGVTSNSVDLWKANGACVDQFGSNAWLGMCYSYGCEGEKDLLDALSASGTAWIRINDIDREGFWEDRFSQ